MKKGFVPIVIILIVIGILVIGGGWIWYAKEQKKIGEIKNQIGQQSTEKDETADWRIYRNEKYGFEIKFTDAWENYMVENISPNSETKNYLVDVAKETIRFKVPYKDCPSWRDKKECYYSKLAIGIFTDDGWNKIIEAYKKSEMEMPFIQIIRNKNYIFAYSTWFGGRDISFDLAKIDFEFEKVISTFKFLD